MPKSRYCETLQDNISYVYVVLANFASCSIVPLAYVSYTPMYLILHIYLVTCTVPTYYATGTSILAGLVFYACKVSLWLLLLT